LTSTPTIAPGTLPGRARATGRPSTVARRLASRLWAAGPGRPRPLLDSEPRRTPGLEVEPSNISLTPQSMRLDLPPVPPRQRPASANHTIKRRTRLTTTLHISRQIASARLLAQVTDEHRGDGTRPGAAPARLSRRPFDRHHWVTDKRESRPRYRGRPRRGARESPAHRPTETSKATARWPSALGGTGRPRASIGHQLAGRTGRADQVAEGPWRLSVLGSIAVAPRRIYLNAGPSRQRPSNLPRAKTQLGARVARAPERHRPGRGWARAQRLALEGRAGSG
jgi:hypothetical protein